MLTVLPSKKINKSRTKPTNRDRETSKGSGSFRGNDDPTDDDEDEERSGSGSYPSEGSGAMNSGDGENNTPNHKTPVYTVLPPVDEPDDAAKPLITLTTLIVGVVCYLLFTTS